MGCFDKYKARVCSYTECKSKHMLHTLALVSENRQRPYIIETMHSYTLSM